MADTAPANASASAPIIPRLIAEAFGTFVLVSAVIGGALYESTVPSGAGFLGIALAVGLAVVISAYAVGSISGGHFNPAVSVGAAAAGRMPWRDVLPYIAAQLVGAILASSIGFGIAAGSPSFNAFTAGGFASNGYDKLSPGHFNLLSVILVELVLTAVFLYVILSVTAEGSTTAGFAPLAIGLTLTLIHLISLPVDGTSVNPARSIATAIYGGTDARADVWVFIVVPIVGALIAGYTWKYLFGRSTLAKRTITTTTVK